MKASTQAHIMRGADIHWPGTGDDLILIAESLTGRKDGIWSAATIIMLLTQPRDRAALLTALRNRIPRATRQGPKMDRATKALAALDRLDALNKVNL